MPTSLTKESEVDVLIIGAGPAGMMCAMALGRYKVNVRIIDKNPNPTATGHADGIQPRIMEVFQSYGLNTRLQAESAHVHMVAFYNPGPDGGIVRTGRAPDVNDPTARYPYEMALHQGAIESIFRDDLTKSGITIERPCIPTSLELSDNEAELADPTAHPVKVTLKHLAATDGQDTEVVYAKFVLGADGAHSWVRRNLGITLEGEQTDFIWGVLDLVPDTDFPDIRNRCAVHSHNGSCMLIPREGELVRYYIQLADADIVDPATGRVDKSRMGPDQLMEVAKKSMHPYRIGTKEPIDWWTLYIIGQRVARKYSASERVFIAGDACHTHSPKAGQGMNASMNDTHNLAWKLAHVLRGWADMSLLKTYESERKKFAQELINFDKIWSTQFSMKPATEEGEDGVTHEQFVKTMQTFGGFTSGIGVHYYPSVVVDTKYQSYASKVIIGKRFPPHPFLRVADARPIELQDYIISDGRYKILVFVGDVTNKAQLAKVGALAEDITAPGSFLKQYSRGTDDTVFDIISISMGSKLDVDFTDIPEQLRSHWSKVLTDDDDWYNRSHGGKGYESYGVNPEGTIVVVRPDGYVGAIAPFDDLQHLNDYFSSFMAVAA